MSSIHDNLFPFFLHIPRFETGCRYEVFFYMKVLDIWLIHVEIVHKSDVKLV